MWVFFGDCEKVLLHVGGDGWLKLLNIGGGSCDRLLNTGGGGGGGGSIGLIKSLNADGDGGDENLSFLLLLLLWSILKILFFHKASSHFIMPSVGLVLVPFKQGDSQWIFGQYQVPLAQSWRQSFVHQMFSNKQKQVLEDFAVKK